MNSLFKLSKMCIMKNFICLFLFSSIIILFNSNISAQNIDKNTVIKPVDNSIETDYLALMEFYNETDGDNWKQNYGWENEQHCNPCMGWYGVTCKKGRVNSVRLQNNNLTGTLTESLTKLDKLEVLLLGENKLSGSIPIGICSLEKLSVLQLTKNNISGQLPIAFGDLKNLEKLFLTHNKIEGIIPDSFGKMKRLQMLYLGANNLSGTLPYSLGELDNLQALVISQNNIQGPLPPTMLDLHISGLEDFDFETYVINK